MASSYTDKEVDLKKKKPHTLYPVNRPRIELGESNWSK